MYPQYFEKVVVWCMFNFGVQTVELWNERVCPAEHCAVSVGVAFLFLFGDVCGLQLFIAIVF